MAYEKSCGAVLYREINELRILIIKQKRNGNWSFPKGHVEKDETETQTAVREVFEEVGLKINPHKGFREIFHYNPRPSIEKDVVYFVANPGKQNVKIQLEEVSDYKWLRPDDALEILTFNNDKEILRKALNFLKETNRI